MLVISCSILSRHSPGTPLYARLRDWPGLGVEIDESKLAGLVLDRVAA
jgi:hypothetical protein